MKFTRSQKKFLKKNLRKLSLAEIAQKLDVEEKALQEYLKSIWSKEKYRKFMTQQRQRRTEDKYKEDKYKKGTRPSGYLRRVGLKPNWQALIFLAFLVFAVYFNSLGNEFVSDDIQAIQKEKNIGNLFFWIKNQPLNFFRYLFYFIIYRIDGLNPALFHLLGVLFHLGSVFIIYILITLLYTSSLALMVASLYAVHPILSEAVVWISGGVHNQYVFFVLLSFLFYLKARLQDKKKYYFASLLSFIPALFTSEKSAVLPLIIVAFEFSENNFQKTWKKTIPYFFLVASCAAVVFLGGFFQRRVDILSTQYFKSRGLYNPLEQIPTALGSYLGLIFWPDKLSLYHSEMSFTTGQFLINLFITLGLFASLIYTFFHKNYRRIFFWLSFFVISLLPMLTPFKVAWIVAERYVYLGALGIFVVIAFALQELGERLADKRIGYGILGVLLILLSARTITRNKDWKNHDALWLAAARTSPSSPQNHNNLGDLYGKRGDLKRAVEEFKKAIELRPGYADAYHNLANVYQEMGKIEEAIENYQKAIEYQPLLWQSHQNLAVIYYEQGQYELALQALEAAVKINPEETNLYVNLAVVYSKLGNQEKAQEAMQKALQLDPENLRVRQLLNSNL